MSSLFDTIGDKLVSLKKEAQKPKLSKIEQTILKYCVKPRTSSEVVALFPARGYNPLATLERLSKQGLIELGANKYVTSLQGRDFEPVMSMTAQKQAGYEKFKEGIQVRVDEAYLQDEASGGQATATAIVMSEPSDEEELVQIQYENGMIDYLGQEWLEPMTAQKDADTNEKYNKKSVEIQEGEGEIYHDNVYKVWKITTPEALYSKLPDVYSFASKDLPFDLIKNAEVLSNSPVYFIYKNAHLSYALLSGNDAIIDAQNKEINLETYLELKPMLDKAGLKTNKMEKTINTIKTAIKQGIKEYNYELENYPHRKEWSYDVLWNVVANTLAEADIEIGDEQTGKLSPKMLDRLITEGRMEYEIGLKQETKIVSKNKKADEVMEEPKAIIPLEENKRQQMVDLYNIAKKRELTDEEKKKADELLKWAEDSLRILEKELKQGQTKEAQYFEDLNADAQQRIMNNVKQYLKEQGEASDDASVGDFINQYGDSDSISFMLNNKVDKAIELYAQTKEAYSKKDYIQFANAIKDLGETISKEELVDKLVDIFKRDTHSFDEERFREYLVSEKRYKERGGSSKKGTTREDYIIEKIKEVNRNLKEQNVDLNTEDLLDTVIQAIEEDIERRLDDEEKQVIENILVSGDKPLEGSKKTREDTMPKDTKDALRNYKESKQAQEEETEGEDIETEEENIEEPAEAEEDAIRIAEDYFKQWVDKEITLKDTHKDLHKEYKGKVVEEVLDALLEMIDSYISELEPKQ